MLFEKLFAKANSVKMTDEEIDKVNRFKSFIKGDLVFSKEDIITTSINPARFFNKQFPGIGVLLNFSDNDYELVDTVIQEKIDNFSKNRKTNYCYLCGFGEEKPYHCERLARFRVGIPVNGQDGLVCDVCLFNKHLKEKRKTEETLFKLMDSPIDLNNLKVSDMSSLLKRTIIGSIKKGKYKVINNNNPKVVRGRRMVWGTHTPHTWRVDDASPTDDAKEPMDAPAGYNPYDEMMDTPAEPVERPREETQDVANTENTDDEMARELLSVAPGDIRRRD